MLQGNQTKCKGSPLMSLTNLFCHIDDFCQFYEPVWYQARLASGHSQRRHASRISLSEMMTPVVGHFHQYCFRDFKTYYTQYVEVYLRREFPSLLSYNRFIQLMPRSLVTLRAYLQRYFLHRLDSPCGVSQSTHKPTSCL